MDSLLIDSVRAIEFSVESSEILVLLFPGTFTKCGVGQGSHQSQGVIKPLLTLNPILSMKNQEKRKLVMPSQGTEKAQRTESPTEPTPS